MNKKVKELVERVRLTPEERLQAEDEALAYLHSQGKVVGVDGFEKRDIAYTVRIFIAEAQLNKVLKEDLALIDRRIKPKDLTVCEACEHYAPKSVVDICQSLEPCIAYCSWELKAGYLPVIPLADSRR